jgi:hypothetical protein
MTHHSHVTHEAHGHVHGEDCGHTPVAHEDHVDYLHDGHLHRPHDDHIDEHAVAAGGANPEGCTPGHDCADHAQDHSHGAECEHEAVPHGEHTDYLVAGHLHHPHGEHCDDHGTLSRA